MRFAAIAALLACSYAHAATPASTITGEVLQVFPGDKFYVEGDTTAVPVYRLSEPFESRMPGSLRIRFSFAIDTTELTFHKRTPEWDYFAAAEGKGRAWHGLLGNVLSEGDTVGLRVNRSSGEREWFVDNSRHNGFTTIWHREVKRKDVEITEAGTRSTLLEGDRMRGLEYLGVRDGQLRIRFSEVGPSPRTEEFTFPISGEEPLLIGAMGLRAEVSEITGASARIKVLRGFQGDGMAEPTFYP